MTVAIDFDGTLKRGSSIDMDEISCWGKVIDAFQQAGHKVIIATMRTGAVGYMDDVSVYLRALQRHADGPIPVVYCGEKGLKKEVCRDAGYKVDIWVDDMPDMIG